MILGGGVYVNGIECRKPARAVEDSDLLEFRGEELPYVGRGGLKLHAALERFGIDVSGRVCIDIGASTGGFTDCLLGHGAAKVYAVDVGTLQLDASLRSDSRVVSMENTDIRMLDIGELGEPPDIAVIDVSFISLRLVLPPAIALLRENAVIVALIKPQFEAGRAALSKRGVVLSEKVRARTVADISEFCGLCGLFVNGVMTSPITGGSGNTEYLICCTKGRMAQ